MDNREEVALFVLIEEHDIQLSKPATGILHIIFVMQWVGLVLCELVAWPDPIGRIQCAFLMTHAPVWDTTGLCTGSPVSQVVYEIIHWAMCGIVALCVVCMILTQIKFLGSKVRKWVVKLNRWIVFLLTEPLFIPIARILSEGLPDRMGWPAFLIGMVSLLALGIITCLARALLMDPLPTTQSWIARAHGRLHIFLTVLQLLVCILLSVLPAEAALLSLSGVSLLLAVAFCYCQPYYASPINALYAVTFFSSTVGALLAAIVTLAAGAGGTLSMMLAWATPFVVLLGLWISSKRFRRRVPIGTDDFPALIRYPFEARLSEFSTVNGKYSPSGKDDKYSDADSDDLKSQRSTSDAASVASHGAKSVASSRASSGKSGGMVTNTICLPITPAKEPGLFILQGGVGKISFASDIELFLRFLYVLDKKIPNELKQNLSAYADSVFKKAFAKYPQSGILMVQYIIFLGFFDEDLPQTFAHIRAIRHRPVALDSKYFAYKVHTRLSSSTHLEDLLIQSQLKSARRHHRNILVQLVQFWKSLCVKNPDIRRLDTISKRIRVQRQGAIKDFQGMLNGSTINPTVFRHWGTFVDTVLLEHEVASRIFIEAKVLEDKYAKANKKKKKRHDDDEDEVEVTGAGMELLYGSGTANAGSLAGSSTIGKLVRNMKIGFGLLVLLLLASALIFYIKTVSIETNVKQLVSAAKVCGKVQQAAAWSEALHLPNVGTRIGMKPTLENVAANLRESHSALTAGDLASSGKHLALFISPSVTATYFYGEEYVLPKMDVANLWDLGFDFVAAVKDVAQEVGSGHGGTAAEKFVIANAHNAAAHAFNHSKYMYVQDAARNMEEQTWEQAILGMLSLISVLLIYLMHSWSFKCVNVEQLIALQLFTQIPKQELAKLLDEAQQQVVEFDKFGESGIEGGDFDQGKDTKKRVGFAVADEADEQGPQGAKPAWDTESDSDTTIDTNEDMAHDNMVISSVAQTSIIVILALQFALSMAAGVLILTIYMDRQAVEQTLGAREEAIGLAQAARDEALYLTRQAQDFSQFGNLHHYENYWTRLNSGYRHKMNNRLMELGATRAEQLKVIESEENSDWMIVTEEVSMALTAKARGIPKSETVEINKFHWDISHEPEFDWANHVDNGLHYSTYERDMALPADEQRLLARSILFDAKFAYYKERVMNPLKEFEAILKKRTQDDTDAVVLLTQLYYELTIIAFLFLSISFIAMLIIQQRTSAIRGLHALRMLNIANALAAILMLVLLGMAVATTASFTNIHEWKEKARTLADEERTQAGYLTDKARFFSQFGDRHGYNDYFHMIHDGEREKTKKELHDMGLSADEEYFADLAANKSDAIILTQEISFVLVISGFQLPWDKFSEVENFPYDFATEPDRDWQLLTFPRRPMWYTSRANDTHQPLEYQKRLARSILFDDKYEYDRKQISDPLDEFARRMDARAQGEIHSLEAEVELIVNLLAVAAVTFMASSIGMVMYLIQKILDFRAQASLDRKLLKLASGNFGNNDRGRSLWAIAGALVLMLSTFTFAVVYLITWAHFSEEIDLASDREWLIIRSLSDAEAFVALAGGANGAARVRLREDVVDILRTRQKLYFGLSAGGDDISDMRLSSEQADIIFGSDRVDSLMEQWVQLCNKLILSNYDSVAEGEPTILAMYEIYDPLIQGMEKSFNVYRTDALSALTNGRILEMIIAVGLSLLILLLYFTIIAPSISHLVDSGEGTQSMLSMIPEDVVNKVPAIAEYLNAAGSEAVEVRAAMMKAEKLLRNILPPSITARLKAGESPIGDLYTNVTLMCTDMVGFTNMSGSLTANELVVLLDSVFCAYDKLAERRNLEKIKTVGDAYIMAGNLLRHPPNVHFLIVEAALETYNVLEEINASPAQTKAGRVLQQRCGLHTGTVVGGVLGHTTLAFDLWGDDVNYASRMESGGIPGKVQISSATYEKVKNWFHVTPHEVEVKGHGLVTAYVVEGHKEFFTSKSK
mmetsp:Transcript_112025/g.194524  ORF Transcript_112025/g.194524 Transcript_112025/m.194524 type:complete len:1980 (-) Transcript_112025:1595-7534(-)